MAKDQNQVSKSNQKRNPKTLDFSRMRIKINYYFVKLSNRFRVYETRHLLRIDLLGVIILHAKLLLQQL